jgi:hypothetical protein
MKRIVLIAAFAFLFLPAAASGAEVAHSLNEFSCTQGMNNWYYGYYEGPYVSSNFRQMTQCVRDVYYPGFSWWANQGQFWTSIRSAVSFPNGASSCGRQPVEHWAVRRWSSEVAGVVTVTGTVHNALGGFDGFRAHIVVDGSTVYSRLVSGAGSTSPVPYSVTFTVAVGSTVDFVVQPNASDCNDHASFTAVINSDATPSPGLPPGVAPGVPSGLTATVAGSTVTLTWTAPLSGGAIASYVIEAGRAPGDSSVTAADTGSPSTTLTAFAVAFGTYFVRVRARNSAGISAPSNEVLILVGGGTGTCTAPPAAPGTLTATVVGRVVTLRWNPPTGPLTTYVLEAGSISGAFDIANVATGLDISLVATAVPGTYFVRVRARNACGTSGSSNEVIVQVF